MLIKPKDVIRMKVPYPSIKSGLAYRAHMYICEGKNESHYEYVKAQTQKPYMNGSAKFSQYIDEQPDISRNPFQRATRIDCEKLFVSDSLEYDDTLKTTSRCNISDELYSKILEKLQTGKHITVQMDNLKLNDLNSQIRKCDE